MANYRYTYDYNGRRYEIDAPKGSTAADLQRIVDRSGGTATARRPAAKAAEKKEEEPFYSGAGAVFKSATGELASLLGLGLEKTAPIIESITGIPAPAFKLIGAQQRKVGEKVTAKAEAERPASSRAEDVRQQARIANAKPGIASEILAGIGRAGAMLPSFSDYDIGGLSRNLLPQTPEDAARALATVQAPFETGRGAIEYGARQAPGMLIPMGGGKAIQLARGAFLPTAGREAAKAALAKEVGTGVVLTGGAINATSAAGQAYKDVLAKGGTQEEADRAYNIALTGAAAVSGVASKIPGLEQRLFSGQPTPGGILRSAGRAAIGEAPQEFVEEGGATLAANVGKLGTAAEVPIGEDVLSSGLLGAVGGATIAAPIGALQGAFSGRDTEAGAPPPPTPAAPPPAGMDDLTQALGPVGGTVTLKDAFGPQVYTFGGFDKKGKVILTDADGVTLSEDPDWVQGAIKSGVVESEDGLGGMAFSTGIEEDVAAPTAEPAPPPPTEKPKFTLEPAPTTGDEFVSNILDGKPAAPSVFSPDVAPPIFSPPTEKPKFTIEPAPPNPRNTQRQSKVGNVIFDQEKGLGQVPLNQNVNYRGFTAMMRPSKFLELAADLENPKQSSLDYIRQSVDEGKSVGSPFLNLDFETGKVQSHDGRHRMMVIQEKNGDVPVPVHIFGKGEQRARSLDEGKINAFASNLTGEDGRQSTDNFSEAFLDEAAVPVSAPPPPPPPPPAAPRAVGKAARATIPATREKVDVQYELQDLDNIRFAEGELQNRDRSRPQTQQFLRRFTSEFDAEGLGEDPATDRGAPIINKDNTILSGNGRTLGLEEIYENYPEQAEAYRQFLREQGYDIEGIERPVLVRRLMSDVDERKFVVGSNEDDKAALSPPEQAAQDAKDILTPGVLSKYNGGDLNAAKNDAFISAFLAELSPQQRENAMDDKGKVSSQALKRIENALLYKAYGGTGRASEIFISKAMERSDDDTKTLTNSLVDVANDWIKFQQAIKDGEVDKKYDITSKLMESVGKVSDIKASGNSVSGELRSPDMVEPMDEFVKDILIGFHNDNISRLLSKKAIAEKLRAYTEIAANQQAEPDMFGMSETPSAREIWKRAAEGEGAQQPDMYASIAEPSTNLTDTPSSTDIMALADELPAAQRVNVRATLDRILSRYEKNGTIDQLLGGLEQLYTAVNNRIKRERAKKDRDRVRGFERAMERSYRAEREGTLTPESANLLRWLLQKNRAIADELALSFEVGEDGDSAGIYNPVERIATIFYSNANDGTAVHEVLHHTERLMPEKIRDGIRAEWTKRIKNLTELAEKTGNTDARDVLGTIVRAYYGDSAARKDLDESYAAGTIPYSMYHLSNPSEFWAVNATELVAKRAQQTGWVGGARKWLEGFIEKAKDFFGLNSNSAVIKALDAVLKEESGKTRGEMIASGGRKLRKDANQKAQEEIEDNAQFRDITSIDAKRTEKKLNELESILNELEKAMKDEAFGVPQMQRQIVSALDNALNSLDDIADNAPAGFNDRIDDLEIKIADLKAIAGASLKPANENRLETEVEKAERELRAARQALDKAFDDDRAYKDRRTKERKAYEKEYDQLEKVYDEAFKKWDKLYREEKGVIDTEDSTQFRDIARPDEQAAEDSDTDIGAMPTPAKLSRVRQSVNRLRTSATWSNIASQFSGIRAADQWLARSYGVESLPETDSFYSAFETYLSKKNGKLQQLRRKYVDPIDDAVGDAIKNGVTMDEINDAIQARGAAERNAAIAEINEDMPDGGSGLTNAEADTILRDLQASGKMRYINRVVRLHDRLRNETQAMMVRDGIIAADTMAQWKRKYPNYTPYKGWAPAGDMAVDGQEDPHADYGSYDKGSPVYSRVSGLRAKPVKAAKGRSSQAANSLYNMIADAEMFLEMGQRNQIALQLNSTYQNDPEAFAGLLKIYDKQNPKIIKGKAVKITDERAFKNGIRGFKNGEPFIIETAPNEEGQAVRRAFTNLDPMQLNKWVDRFIRLMGVMRGLHTRFNAAFWPREFLRSISDAVGNVYTEKGRKRSAAYGKSAAMKTWKYSWDPATQAGVFAHLINRDAGSGRIAHVKALTEEMVVNGGAAGQEFAERAERVAKRMEAELERMTATGVKAGYFETKAGFAKLIKVVDGINDFVDIVPRVAAYRALTEAGVAPKDAAQIALRSTLDMSKRGRFGRIIDSIFWWTTPSITNLTKKITGLDSSTYRKLVLAQLSVGFALGMLNIMNAPDSDDDGEDDYSQLPEWRKLAYLHVYYSPDKEPFTMPVGFLFLFERYVGGKMAEVLAGKISDGKAAVDIMTASQDVGVAFLASLSPVVRSTETRTLIPSSIAPLYDLNVNESFFKAPIYNEPFDDSEAQASRAKRTTPEVYKMIAKGLQEATGGYGRVAGGIDVSPDQIKYFVDQYAGGVGRLVGGAIEGDIEAVKKLNPFYFDPKLVEYSPMSSFYERDPEMKRAIAADKLADEGDSSERDFLENNNPVSVDSGVISAFKDAEKELKDLRKDANDMDPDEYRAEQLRIMSDFNRAYNDAKKGNYSYTSSADEEEEDFIPEEEEGDE